MNVIRLYVKIIGGVQEYCLKLTLTNQKIAAEYNIIHTYIKTQFARSLWQEKKQASRTVQL